MTGIIQLVHEGNIIRQAQYITASQKGKIIRAWREQYGPAFTKAKLVDDPDLPISKPSPYKKGGMHTKYRLNKDSGRNTCLKSRDNT